MNGVVKIMNTLWDVRTVLIGKRWYGMINLVIWFLVIIFAIIIVGLFYAGLFLIIYFLLGFVIHGTLQVFASLVILFIIIIVSKL